MTELERGDFICYKGRYGVVEEIKNGGVKVAFRIESSTSSAFVFLEDALASRVPSTWCVWDNNDLLTVKEIMGGILSNTDDENEETEALEDPPNEPEADIEDEEVKESIEESEKEEEKVEKPEIRKRRSGPKKSVRWGEVRYREYVRMVGGSAGVPASGSWALGLDDLVVIRDKHGEIVSLGAIDPYSAGMDALRRSDGVVVGVEKGGKGSKKGVKVRVPVGERRLRLDVFEEWREKELRVREQHLDKRKRRHSTGETRQFSHVRGVQNPLFDLKVESERRDVFREHIRMQRALLSSFPDLEAPTLLRAVHADGVLTGMSCTCTWPELVTDDAGREEMVREVARLKVDRHLEDDTAVEALGKVEGEELTAIRSSREKGGCSCRNIVLEASHWKAKDVKAELERRGIVPEGTKKKMLAQLESAVGSTACNPQECECHAMEMACIPDICNCKCSCHALEFGIKKTSVSDYRRSMLESLGCSPRGRKGSLDSLQSPAMSPMSLGPPSASTDLPPPLALDSPDDPMTAGDHSPKKTLSKSAMRKLQKKEAELQKKMEREQRLAQLAIERKEYERQVDLEHKRLQEVQLMALEDELAAQLVFLQNETTSKPPSDSESTSKTSELPNPNPKKKRRKRRKRADSEPVSVSTPPPSTPPPQSPSQKPRNNRRRNRPRKTSLSN